MAVEDVILDWEIIQEFKSGIVGVQAFTIDSNMPVLTNGNGVTGQCDQSLDVENFRGVFISGDRYALGAEDANITSPGSSKIKGDTVYK